MKKHGTIARLFAGFLSALMILAPLTVFAGSADVEAVEAEAVEDTFIPYDADASEPFYFALGEGVGTYAKDQGDYGTCWAFSVVGASEASLIAQGRTFNKGTPANASNIDLSELHTAFFFYNTETDPLGNMQNDRSAIVGDTYLTGGGNNMLTSMALMAWKGLALESICPYSSITGPRHPVDQSLAHRELDQYERYNSCQGNDRQIRRSSYFL